MVDALIKRFFDFLPLAQFPIRSGIHGNSAFSLFLALEHARIANHAALERLVVSKARQWFGADERYPAAYEPGGDDFLSGGLMEAALMRSVLDDDCFAEWWHSFCPSPEAVQTWLSPVSVLDRSDPKLVHLDGLNLSRAWCWRILLPGMPKAMLPHICRAIDAHVDVSLQSALQGHYAGTHWLASFALLALSLP